MSVIDLISRYLHVTTAIWMAGGAVFLRLVLQPALETGADPAFDDSRAELGESVRRRWARFVAIGTLLLLSTGLWNYLAVAAPRHKGDGLYHGLMGGKMLLAFVAFFLAAALSGRSEKLAGIRRHWRVSGAVLLTCLAVVVLIGSYLKMRGTVTLLAP